MTIGQKVIVTPIENSKSQLEQCHVYIMGATVFYPVVHEPREKYESKDREYSLTAFVNEQVKDKLLDDVMLNKQIMEVGKDKTKKRKVKYPLSSQVEDGKPHYDEVKGMFGVSLTKPEFSKAGNKQTVTVIDASGKAFTENVGNGSVCNIKLYGYKNKDGQLTVQLDTLQVVDLVPYEAKEGNNGTVVDDILGVTYQVNKADTDTGQKEKTEPVQQRQEPEPQDDLDEDIPF